MKTTIKVVETREVETSQAGTVQCVEGILVLNVNPIAFKFLTSNEILDDLKPIIVSETEQIKRGDWVYDALTRLTFEALNTYTDSQKKVLVLSQHFTEKQLQAIADGKMKNGDRVLVECEEKHDGSMVVDMNSMDIVVKQPLTLHKIEERVYTKVEMIQFSLDTAEGIYSHSSFAKKWKGKLSHKELEEKWFEEHE